MIVVSMATMTERIPMLKQTLPTILNQSLKFDKLLINVTTDTTEKDLKFYTEIASWDNRIAVLLCNDGWRSCNKLLPALRMYSNSEIITVDDDVRYGQDWLESLYRKHLEFPDCIIAIETCPIILNNGNFDVTANYSLGIDTFKTYNRYFSRATLYPVGTFSGTDIFNFDKMMELTDGVHDELWFYVNSTLNGFRVVECPVSFNMDLEDFSITHPEGSFQLTTDNLKPERVQEYNKRITDLYGEKLLEAFNKKPIELLIHKGNLRLIANSFPFINYLYNGYPMKIALIEPINRGEESYLNASISCAKMIDERFMAGLNLMKSKECLDNKG